MCYQKRHEKDCHHWGGIEEHRLLETNREVDEVINKITELNDLVYAGSAVVTEMLGVKKEKAQEQNHGEKENRSTSKQRPWTKLNKDHRHINTVIEKKNIKMKHKYGLERSYKMKQKGVTSSKRGNPGKN